MEMEGKIWKDGRFWLVEVPTLDAMTQGRTRKEALSMIEDLVMEMIKSYFSDQMENDFKITVTDYKKNVIGVASNDHKLLLALSLRKQREKSGSTIREAGERLGSKSQDSRLTALIRYTIVMLTITTSGLFATTGTWTPTGTGNWNTGTNWTSNPSFPNGIDDVANFGNSITGNAVVSLGAGAQNITIGRITLDNSHNYTIQSGSAGNTLIFNASSGTANCTITDVNGNGAHTISTPITLNSNLALSQGSTATFTLSGPISGTGGVTISGSGTAFYNSLSLANTYTGTTTVSGTLTTTNQVCMGGNLVVNGGSVTLGGGNILPSTCNITLNGGSITGPAATAASLNFQAGTFTTTSTPLTLLSSNPLTMRGGTSLTSLSGGVRLTGSTPTVAFDTTSGGTATIGIMLLNSPTTFNIPSGGAIVDMNITGAISGTSFTKMGNGVLELSGSANNTVPATITQGTLQLNKGAGVNAFAGSSLINGGTLQLASASQISNSSSLTLSSGTFDTGGFAFSCGEFIFNGGAILNPAGLTLTSAGIALSMRNVTLPLNTTLTAGGSIAFDNTSGGTATISGNINLGTTTTFSVPLGNASPNPDMLVTGIISNGGVTKTGTGLLSFTGSSANTYTGTTTVTAGTLLLNKPTGVNAIGGGLTINGGTLSMGAVGQNPTTSTLTMLSGTFNMGGFPSSFNNFIFHGGTFTQANTLTLTSAATALSMQGVTLPINSALTGGGSIAFDNSVSGGAIISGNIDLGSSMTTFNIPLGTTSADMTITGAISNGGLQKTNTGTLVLRGANIYSGGTTVSGGTLEGDTTGLQGNITNNANLVFDQSTTGSYVSSMSGPGSLVKQGAGKLILSNSNSVGNVSVTNGILAVDGTLGGGGTLTTLTGTTLQGIGSITKDATINGILAPGDSIGTLTLIGNQTLTPGSTLAIEVNPTTSDMLIVDGSLLIDLLTQSGVTLNVLPEPGQYSLPSTYEIIHTTGGVTGTFFNITTLPLFDVTPIYSAFDVSIVLDSLNFSTLFNKGNAGAVAQCLDSLADSSCPNLSSIISDLRMISSQEVLENALLQMQPSAFTSLAVVQENDLLYLQNAVSNRLENHLYSCCLSVPTAAQNKKANPPQPVTLWINALGAHTSQKSQNEEPGFTANSPGILVGVDFSIGEKCFLGGAVGQTYSYLNWKEERGNARILGFYTLLYGSFFTKHAYLQGAFIGGYSDYTVERFIQLPFLSRTSAKSDHQGGEGLANIKAGLNYGCSLITISPYINFDYLFIYENSFLETGAQSLNLDVKSKNSNLLSSEIGIDLSHCFRSNAHAYTPFVKISAIRESRFSGRKERASFECGCDMTVKGLYPSRTLCGVNAGLNAQFNKNTLALFYQGKFNSEYSDNSIYLQYFRQF